MKKTIEIEYVGIEDVYDILDDAVALSQNGHYIDVEFRPLGKSMNPYVTVYIMLCGFERHKDWDYEFSFSLTDDEKDVAVMNECKSILCDLLTEEGE